MARASVSSGSAAAAHDRERYRGRASGVAARRRRSSTSTHTGSGTPFAHQGLAADGAEIDLMQLAGWHSRKMLSRYGASAAGKRAIAAYRRLAPGDRL